MFKVVQFACIGLPLRFTVMFMAGLNNDPIEEYSCICHDPNYGSCEFRKEK